MKDYSHPTCKYDQARLKFVELQGVVPIYECPKCHRGYRLQEEDDTFRKECDAYYMSHQGASAYK